MYGRYVVKLESHYVYLFYLIICLAGAEFPVKIQIQELVEKQYTLDPPKVRPLIRRQKAKIAESDKRSIGYETMTTVSDLDSEVRFSVFSLDNA